MFAHNNDEIDYISLAAVNSRLIQKNMGLSADQITIVTNNASYEYFQSQHDQDYVSNTGQFIINNKDPNFKRTNMRVYRDTSHNTQKLSFYNLDRCDAYELSPYDETLLIDADYLVLSDALNSCWGHHNELMMNHHYVDVVRGREYRDLDRIHALGITMYWATVVYFTRTPLCESFFKVAKHVSQEREYYRDLYKIPSALHRNDHSFSIAAHMVSGYKDKGLPQLPIKLYKSFDIDDVDRVNGPSDLLLMVEKPSSPGDFTGLRWKDVDIHIMNKWALQRIQQGVLDTL